MAPGNERCVQLIRCKQGKTTIYKGTKSSGVKVNVHFDKSMIFSELSFRLLLVVGFVMVADALKRSNVGQAEATRLSPDVDAVTTIATDGPETSDGVVGVVEPGRLLNIFLGATIVIGFLVFNSLAIIALGLTGTISRRRPNIRRSGRPRPVTVGEGRLNDFDREFYIRALINRFRETYTLFSDHYTTSEIHPRTYVAVISA